MTPTQLTWLDGFAKAAVEDEQESGCPALLSIAQAILESGWGSHAPGNNYYGIKYYAGAPGIQSLLTTEYINGVAKKISQRFAAFTSSYECIKKHSQLITQNKRYQPAFQEYKTSGNLEHLVHGIAPIYATDPGYANKLLTLMSMKSVVDAVNAAKTSFHNPA
jgi:flagellum-specific peptidoglycan hydrolase FlgJ